MALYSTRAQLFTGYCAVIALYKIFTCNLQYTWANIATVYYMCTTVHTPTPASVLRSMHVGLIFIEYCWHRQGHPTRNNRRLNPSKNVDAVHLRDLRPADTHGSPGRTQGLWLRRCLRPHHGILTARAVSSNRRWNASVHQKRATNAPMLTRRWLPQRRLASHGQKCLLMHLCERRRCWITGGVI